MGVRIDAHAVDVVALERVLERPLWHVLADLADPNRGPLGQDILFDAFDWESWEGYHVLPDRRVVLLRRDGTRRELTREVLREVPFLRQSTRRYLSGPDRSALTLLFLLRDLPVIDGYRYAYEITSGHRRWWIGSALHAAGNRLPGTALEELKEFFSRILSDYDCAYPLPHRTTDPVLYDSPGVPEDAGRLAVFTEPECHRFVTLLDRLMQGRPSFQCPPELLGDGEDRDWTGYVTERVEQFRRIRTLRLPNLRMVTFID